MTSTNRELESFDHLRASGRSQFATSVAQTRVPGFALDQRSHVFCLLHKSFGLQQANAFLPVALCNFFGLSPVAG